MKRIFALFIMAVCVTQLKAQVVINEYSCSNISTIMDAYGNNEDWVELYNTGSSAVSLSGYYMSDNKYAPTKWQVPAGVSINPGGRLLVFCNDQNAYFGGQLHTSFKLTQTKGEYFVLANAGGTIVDSVHLFVTQGNHSYGRKSDGGAQWGIFSTPNPNAANSGGKDAYATRPVFSVAPGFYSATQNVAITSPDPNVQIRYTTDGSAPTLTSTLYTVPVVVSATSVIRAVAFSSNTAILPSFIETNTYLINENTTMNVVSFSGTFEQLVNGWGAGQNTECSFEFFDKSHQFKFEQNGIWRRHGHDSWAYDQRSFRFYSRDQYGYDYAMKYKFFNTSAKDTFQQIIIKAAGSDNYPGDAFGTPSNMPSCHIRDVFAHTLAFKYGLKFDNRKYEPAICFINGQYWGVYELREKVNEEFFDYYYGQTAKKVDHLSYWGGLQVRAGSDTGWNNLYNFMMNNSLTIPANYEHVKNFLDVEGFAQYFIYNTWLVNSDWLTWNTMWWRGRKGQGVKWRYAAWDMDNIMDLGQNFTGWPTTTNQANPCEPFTMFQNNGSIKHTDMLAKLMQNPEFEQLYRNTFIDMLNGPLNCANMVPHFDSLINIIQPEMQRHINKWGNATYNYTQWQTNVQYMRNQILGRCQVIAQKLDSCMDLNPQQISYNVVPAGAGTIQMYGNTVSPYVWTKIIAADTVIDLNATPTNSYYFFDHWEKYEVANSFAPDDTTDAVDFTFHKKDSVVAYFGYFNPDSINVTFDVFPAGSGTVLLNSVGLSGYPYTVKLDRRYTNTLMASGLNGYKFVNWRKKRANSTISPTVFNSDMLYNFTEADTVTAVFEKLAESSTLPNTPNMPVLDQQMIISNAFSPNGDGRNDVFHIIKGKDVKSIDLRIYDRWGKEVFVTNDPAQGWDGTFAGKEMPIGVYYYVLTVYLNNEYQTAHKMYKGEINLIR